MTRFAMAAFVATTTVSGNFLFIRNAGARLTIPDARAASHKKRVRSLRKYGEQVGHYIVYTVDVKSNF
jgi:hypothetical protein